MPIWDFNLVMHAFHAVSGITAIFTGFHMYRYHITVFYTWPKKLRIYFIYFCFLTGIVFAFNSTIMSSIAIFTNNAKTTVYHSFRLSLTFLCQQLRFAYFFYYFGTNGSNDILYLEKYAKFSSTIKVYGIFFILSIFGHIICTLTAFLKFFEILPSSFTFADYDNIIWISFVIHATTLISCKCLYDKNQQMYKRLAYQCSLQQRHQIVENIKVLKVLWPTILVFSVVAPIGPTTALIYTLITKFQGPIGLFHMTYNFAPIMMAFYCKFQMQTITEICPTESVIKENHLVISPLGNILPTHVSQENYFKELRNQWIKK